MKTINQNINKIFLIGILGTGMTSLAKYLMDMGIQVSGSDIQDFDGSKYLYDFRHILQFFRSHEKSNIIESAPDEIVYSNAISAENPEILYAVKNNIRELSRPQKLAELAKDKTLALITGTHGKSSITALSSYISTGSEIPCSYLIGAIPYGIPPAIYSKESEYLILEGDESNRDILLLNPEILVISSMEWDHPETYESNEEMKDLYRKLISKDSLKTVIYNKSYTGLDDLIGDNKRDIQYISYSLNMPADATLNQRKGSGAFIIDYLSESYELKIRTFGLYSIENAMAAFLLMKKLGIDTTDIIKKTAEFEGVQKRMEMVGRLDELIIFIDYSHHPTELSSVLTAIKERYPDDRLVLIFEPHMPSRMKLLFSGFMDAFSLADNLVLTEVFTARRDPDKIYKIKDNMGAVRERYPDAYFYESHESILSFLKKISKEHAVCVVSSAGPLGEYLKRRIK